MKNYMAFGMRVKLQPLFFGAGILFLTLTGCSSNRNQAATPPGSITNLGEGKSVLVYGSTSLLPFMNPITEKFKKANPAVRTTIGGYSTGTGFKRFCAGDTDITMAARPINKSEIETCQKNKIEFVELPVGLTAVAVVINRTNTWATCLKPEELAKIWEPAASGKIVNWKQVRNDYPDQPLILYAYGAGSGTVDFFTEAIVGEVGNIRNDYKIIDGDDSLLAQAVGAEPNGMGFFSFAYYKKFQNVLNSVAIENKEGKCIQPSPETIADGSYTPLILPMLIYVSKTALKENPDVKAFVKYQLDPANRHFISEGGYVPLPDDLLAHVQARLDNAIAGSIYEGKSPVGVKLADKLATPQKR
jgi:phosphate transport system substrate-binding protein